MTLNATAMHSFAAPKSAGVTVARMPWLEGMPKRPGRLKRARRCARRGGAESRCGPAFIHPSIHLSEGLLLLCIAAASGPAPALADHGQLMKPMMTLTVDRDTRYPVVCISTVWRTVCDV